MLQVDPLLTAPLWPVSADATTLLAIVQAQAVTIADLDAQLGAYQLVLHNAQAPPPTTGLGTGSGNNLNVTSVTGSIFIGATVTGTGIPASTTIIAQQSGTLGGVGIYTTSQPTTAAGAALTFTPGSAASPWPVPRDDTTLNAIMQAQAAVLRSQTALVQQYQDLLNVSQTASPTGP